MTNPTGSGLQGKAVFVSGGTTGVGAATVRAAARAGAEVAFSGRRAESAATLLDSLRDEELTAHFIRADIGDPAAAAGSVQQAVQTLGRLDGLVNSAGLVTRGTLLNTTVETFDQLIAVNLRGPFFAMQAAVRHLLERKSPGSIVNVISISEHGGTPYLAPYVAAKAGLAGLTKNVAQAHRFDRIRINGVNIGWTETEGEAVVQKQAHGAGDDWSEVAGRSLPMGKLGQPAEIAAFLVFLLSDESGVVTGSILDWDQTVIGAYD